MQDSGVHNNALIISGCFILSASVSSSVCIMCDKGRDATLIMEEPGGRALSFTIKENKSSLRMNHKMHGVDIG